MSPPGAKRGPAKGLVADHPPKEIHLDRSTDTGVGYGDLGPRARRALRHGHTFGGDPSSSAAIRSFVVGAVNAGWPFDRIVREALERVNAGGRKAQDIADTRGMPAALKYLRREYESARGYVHRNAQVLDANGALLSIVEWSEAVDSVTWKGAGGITDRNALEAMGRRAETLKSATSIPMSVRTLAEEIGVVAPTASRALHRVRKTGWLRLAKAATQELPAVYALSVPTCEATATSPHADLAREMLRLLHTYPAGDDAWRWRALGKGSQRVYALVKEISAAAEIASLLGISKRAVYQHLAKLSNVGLVENREGRWVHTGKDLDVVAAEYGTLGDGDVVRRRHQDQREGHHGQRLDDSEAIAS